MSLLLGEPDLDITAAATAALRGGHRRGGAMGDHDLVWALNGQTLATLDEASRRKLEAQLGAFEVLRSELLDLDEPDGKPAPPDDDEGDDYTEDDD